MRILIGKPIRHIEMFRKASAQGIIFNEDVEKLYDILPDIITRLGHECVVIEMIEQLRRVYQEKNSIFLGWHNHGTTKNTWFIKSAYIPNYFYFDKTGYSGWSELAETYDYEVDIDSIRDDVNDFANYYISNNISRYQSSIENTPKTPYVVVFEQRPDDAVADFAYIPDLSSKVIEAFKGTKYNVAIRPHPFNLEWKNSSWQWSINDTGSLHKLIAGSAAVYTVNSGAGFEALLHKKRVFTVGHCDYRWVTTTLKTDKEIRSSIDLIEEPIDEDNIIKFLHYCMNYHFMNVNDEESIIRKINRAVDEYNQ